MTILEPLFRSLRNLVFRGFRSGFDIRSLRGPRILILVRCPRSIVQTMGSCKQLLQEPTRPNDHPRSQKAFDNILRLPFKIRSYRSYFEVLTLEPPNLARLTHGLPSFYILECTLDVFFGIFVLHCRILVFAKFEAKIIKEY